MKKMLCMIAGILAAIGAINWGLVGLFEIDLVQKFFGTMPQVAKITYIVIGLAGLVSAACLFQGHDYKD